MHERARGAAVGAWRAADAEVDPAGKLGRHRAEVLGHFERAVVGQHDPAGADANLRRPRRNLWNQHLRRGAGQRAGVVMLGQPVAGVAQSIAGLGQLERLRDRRGRSTAVTNRNLIEHAEAYVGRHGMILQRRPGVQPGCDSRAFRSRFPVFHRRSCAWCVRACSALFGSVRSCSVRLPAERVPSCSDLFGFVRPAFVVARARHMRCGRWSERIVTRRIFSPEAEIGAKSSVLREIVRLEWTKMHNREQVLSILRVF